MCSELFYFCQQMELIMKHFGWKQVVIHIIQTNGGTKEGWHGHDQRQVCVSEWESGWDLTFTCNAMIKGSIMIQDFMLHLVH